MTFFVGVDGDGFVVVQMSHEATLPGDGVGPPSPIPEGPYSYHQIDAMASGADKPSVSHKLKWLDGALAWVDIESIASKQARKVAEISEACSNHILAGFKSSALGAEYSYPAKLVDQHNLVGSITRSLFAGNPPDWSTPFWCADAAGEWQFRAHTAAQIQQVGSDATDAIIAARVKNENLRQQIMVASATQLASINW